jgi:hypothetical protein
VSDLPNTQLNFVGNPFADVIPDDEFTDLLVDTFHIWRRGVLARYSREVYPHDYAGMAMFYVADRLAPVTMAWGYFGGEAGHGCVLNGMGKACARIEGRTNVRRFLTNPVPGDFRWLGTYLVGASSQTARQDRWMARDLAVPFDEGVTTAFEEQGIPPRPPEGQSWQDGAPLPAYEAIYGSGRPVLMA